MIPSRPIAPLGKLLSELEIIETLHQGLDEQFENQKVLLLISDHTRSLPLPFLFRAMVENLCEAHGLHFIVALAMHPALTDDSLNQLVGITSAERASLAASNGLGKASVSSYQNPPALPFYPPIQLFNHAWDDPAALTSLGTIEQDQIKHIARELWHSSLPDCVDVRLNKAAMAYDHIYRRVDREVAFHTEW